MKKHKVHISYYDEFPIYEPAEGGYYYAGAGLSSTTKLMSKTEARAKMDEYWNECKKENFDMYGKEDDFARSTYGNAIDENNNYIYPWVRASWDYIFKESKYIGEGAFIIVERKLGHSRKGYVPYE